MLKTFEECMTCRSRGKVIWGPDGGKDHGTPWPVSQRMFHGDVLVSFWMSTRQPSRMRSWKRATFCHLSLKQQFEPLLQDDISALIYVAFTCICSIYSCIQSFRYRHRDIKHALGGSRPMIKSSKVKSLACFFVQNKIPRWV